MSCHWEELHLTASPLKKNFKELFTIGSFKLPPIFPPYSPSPFLLPSPPLSPNCTALICKVCEFQIGELPKSGGRTQLAVSAYSLFSLRALSGSSRDWINVS